MTLDEVASCCVSDNRQRFERELLRLKAYRFRSLRIVSSEEAILAHQYRSDITPRAVLASLYAWQAKFDCPLVFCPSAEGAARLDLGDLWPTRGPREAPQSPILACFPSSKAQPYLLERLASPGARFSRGSSARFSRALWPPQQRARAIDYRMVPRTTPDPAIG
jgi:hypothetical protein